MCAENLPPFFCYFLIFVTMTIYKLGFVIILLCDVLPNSILENSYV